MIMCVRVCVRALVRCVYGSVSEDYTIHNNTSLCDNISMSFALMNQTLSSDQIVDEGQITRGITRPKAARIDKQINKPGINFRDNETNECS